VCNACATGRSAGEERVELVDSHPSHAGNEVTVDGHRHADI
jgi:hypothetical protein